MSALHFTLIGAGQTVEKYWLKCEQDGLVAIDHIISLEDQQTFATRLPTYSSRYLQTSGTEETLNILKSLGPSQNIGLLIPYNKLELAQSLLDLAPNYFFSLFWEKPYIMDLSHTPDLQNLIRTYSDRIHLSGKYGSSRADILYPHLPENQIPHKIIADLIEGSTYYHLLTDHPKPNPNHHFLNYGPELDLGFHALDIISTFCLNRVSPVKMIHFSDSDVSDQSLLDPAWQPGYGFTAHLQFELENGSTFPVDLTSGKFSGATHRRLEFVYPEFSIFQDYSTPEPFDPVYKSKANQTIQVDHHTATYNYYAQELSPAHFAHQSITHQLSKLYLNEVCLQIKQARLMTSSG